MRPRDPLLQLDQAPDPHRTLGTYAGVFQPTLLTILGVILYLREGWIVGNAGLLGALSIIALTFLITGATALSFSSIATNIRLGGGGPFSLVAKSLGLEAGGAIGIPLYLGQAFSIAFYMHGLAEAWLYLFPEHPRSIVLLAIYVGGFALSVASERLVLRAQFLVMIGVIVAIASIWGGVITAPEVQRPEVLGSFEAAGYWHLFAVFFPAGTGIMVGASLSGKLREPRRSIPRGIMGAWAVAFGVYVVTAIAMALFASPEQLKGDLFIAMHGSAFGPAVLLGLLSSSFSAMLGSLVAAPNVLQPLAEHDLIPASGLFKRMTPNGTPRWCVAFTAFLVGLAIAFGDLDSVARLITTTFLLTYATINIVVFIEQGLAMISFRPTLRVPIAVPLLGTVGSTLVLVQSEPALGFAALTAVVSIYFVLSRRRVRSPWETVRSGLVVAFAHRAADLVQRIQWPQYRAWKPDILVPIKHAAQLAGESSLLEALARERGSVQVIAVGRPDPADSLVPRLDRAIQDFRSEHLIATHVEMPVDDLVTAVRTSAAVLDRTLIRPNILFVNTSETSPEELRGLESVARQERLGFAVLAPHPDAGMGRRRRVTVWVRFQEKEGLTAIGRSNVDLLLLLGYQLHRNWGAQLRLVTAVPEGSIDRGRAMLRLLRSEARLPRQTETSVLVDSFENALAAQEGVDIHLIGLPDVIDPERLADFVDAAGATCLFLRDSGLESAFA